MIDGGIWAAVPVKTLSSAKQRLTPILSPLLRQTLVLAMLSDVLAALCDVKELRGILVISPDADVLRVAARAGARGVFQNSDIGLAESATEVARVAVDRYQASSLLVVTADLACATAADFEYVIAAHCGVDCTIVPSWDAGGTNCVMLSPPGIMRFLFGTDSYRRHLAQAAAAGIATCSVHNTNLGLDIDTPTDLINLYGTPCSENTRQFLSQLCPVSPSIAVPCTRGQP